MLVCRSRIHRYAATAIRKPAHETYCFVLRLIEGAFLEVSGQASLLSLESLRWASAVLSEIFRAQSLETVSSKGASG